MLERLGYGADLVVNGIEVLKALEHTAYDIILMDLHMPLMGGVEATTEVRKRPFSRQPVIVALTASATNSDREQCLHAGMDDYLSKPINMQVLRDTILLHTPSFPPAVPQRPTPGSRTSSSSLPD